MNSMAKWQLMIMANSRMHVENSPQVENRTKQQDAAKRSRTGAPAEISKEDSKMAANGDGQ